MKYTKKAARETIGAFRDSTSYFDGVIERGQMYDMLRYRMGFGEAEAHVIIAALILAGAKFREE